MVALLATYVKLSILFADICHTRIRFVTFNSVTIQVIKCMDRGFGIFKIFCNIFAKQSLVSV